MLLLLYSCYIYFCTIVLLLSSFAVNAKIIFKFCHLVQQKQFAICLQ